MSLHQTETSLSNKRHVHVSRLARDCGSALTDAELIEAARAIAQGDRRAWRTSIPPQSGDSDVVIATLVERFAASASEARKHERVAYLKGIRDFTNEVVAIEEDASLPTDGLIAELLEKAYPLLVVGSDPMTAAEHGGRP